MDKKILAFNIVFYFITLFFYYQGRQDPSSSLGYGFFIVGFWGVSLVTLAILLAKKVIQPKSILDKIGIVTATPLLPFLAVGLIMTLNETPASEWYFDKDHHRYKVNTFNFRGSGHAKRIEYYKSADTVNPKNPFANVEKWLKDSTWVYFSKPGDTSKIVKYKDGELLK